MNFILYHGDCLEQLKRLEDSSVDSIVTDPPYGLSFMGKKWDYDVPSQDVWAECLRVLKPGGHLLAFAGTRTQHRMAVRIEDAGFEIRDMIAWVYGSGFPKSHDVSKAIDKAAGAERTEVVGKSNRCVGPSQSGENGIGTFKEVNWQKSNLVYAPATEAAKQWQGWGTALKPSLEPVTVARKPLIGTVADNVLAHGTGAINVDGCRVASDDAARGGNTERSDCTQTAYGTGWQKSGTTPEAGRWPANLIHDGSDEVVALAGEQARFFYCAKASKRDRDEGLEGFEIKRTGGMQATADGSMLTGSGNERTTTRANVHPTVKPTDLMRYLCRLVTPPGGIVLDPFMGSGSTGKAAVLEGFQFIGIERELEYLEIAKARIESSDTKDKEQSPQLNLL
jgi:DNA modification methylase